MNIFTLYESAKKLLYKGTITTTFVIVMSYSATVYLKERNKEVSDSRAITLSNKNRTKKSKQMERDLGDLQKNSIIYNNDREPYKPVISVFLLRK
jgi:hypothetical protein